MPTDFSALPLDRGFADRFLESFDPDRLHHEFDVGALRITSRTGGEPKVEAAGITLGVQFLLFDDGVIRNVLEVPATLVPRSVYCQPTRALRHIEQQLAAMPERIQARLERLASPDQDTMFDALYEVVAWWDDWEGGAPETREWMEADHTVVEWNLNGALDLLSHATTPRLSLAGLYDDAFPADGEPPDRLKLEDGYRVGAETVRLIQAEGTLEGLSRLAPLTSLLVTSELDAALAHPSVPALVLARASSELASNAMELFRAGSIRPGIAWAARPSELEQRIFGLLDAPGLGDEPVLLARWLADGLAEERWKEPHVRPPVITDASGWVAFVILFRGVTDGVISAAEARSGVDALLLLGASLDPEGPETLQAESDVLQRPRLEAERAGVSVA